jgi:hypothetical protein
MKNYKILRKQESAKSNIYNSAGVLDALFTGNNNAYQVLRMR